MSRPLRVVAPTAAVSAYEDPAVAVEFQARARREGQEFDAIALDLIEAAGATVVRGAHHRCHYPVDAEIVAANGTRFVVLAHGNIGDSSTRPGLERPDTLAKVASRVTAMAWHHQPPVVVVTSHLPKPASTCAHQLADLRVHVGAGLADVVAVTGDLAGFHRLRRLFTTTPPPAPVRAPWWNPGHDLTLFDQLDAQSADA